MSAGRGACRGSSRRASSAVDIIDIILSEAPRCGGRSPGRRRDAPASEDDLDVGLLGGGGARGALRRRARGSAHSARGGVRRVARRCVGASAGERPHKCRDSSRRARRNVRIREDSATAVLSPRLSTDRPPFERAKIPIDESPRDRNISVSKGRSRRSKRATIARPLVRDRDDHRPRRTLLGDRGDPRARPPRPRHTSRRGSSRARTSACLLTARLRPDASRVGRHLARGSSRRGVVGYSKNSRRRASRATMDGWASRGGGAGVGNLARKPAKPSSSGRKLTIKPFKGASAPPPRDAPRDRSGSPPHSATPPARLARARSLPCSSARP